MAGFKGQLLVATPVLTDPNFDRTVVFLLEHNEDGALGVVLNRPSPLDVGEPLPEWRRFTDHPDVVFFGGPVARNAVIALGRLDGTIDDTAWEPVLGAVGVLDLTHDPDTIGGGLGGVRIFAGYAGWGPGQLEDEIAEGAWYVVPAEPGDAFTEEPESLWRTVLARQPGELARVAMVPADPRVN